MIIGIIKTNTNLQNISGKLITTLSQHFDNTAVSLENDKMINYKSDEISFDCEITLPDYEIPQLLTFYLTSAEVY